MGRRLDAPVKLDVSDTGTVYAWVEIGGGEGGYHPADDDRNPRGGSPVVNWGVDDDDQVRERRIAQLRDPFGTIVGTEGP
ncbi:hypothetical protein ACFWH1_07050 [Streptomyces sp. NPDC127037]|uniref:hypothetical protein n=1 Tax=Streptomyces sp. NPDC127037 TaxID=3347113 RepID=UPI003649FBAD